MHTDLLNGQKKKNMIFDAAVLVHGSHLSVHFQNRSTSEWSKRSIRAVGKQRNQQNALRLCDLFSGQMVWLVGTTMAQSSWHSTVAGWDHVRFVWWQLDFGCAHKNDRTICDQTARARSR